MDGASGEIIREVGASVRSLAWPAVIVVLALVFRHGVAALLARVGTLSVSVPGFGLSVSAPVMQLLRQADTARTGRRAANAPAAAADAAGFVRSAPPHGPATDRRPSLVWVDERPDAGANEIAALLATGCDVLRLARPEDAATRSARVIVLASADMPDAALRRRAKAALPEATQVLYPDVAAEPHVGTDAPVPTDPASLFATVIGLLNR